MKICRGLTRKLDVMSVEMKGPDGEHKTLYSVLGFIMGLISDIDIESEHLRFLGQAVRTNLYAVMRIATFRNFKITLSYLPVDDAVYDSTRSTDDSESCDKSSSSASTTSLINDHLAPFAEAVPSNWRTVENELIQVSGLGLSHVSEDITFHPSVQLDDGKMMLALIKSSTTRRDLLKYWDFLEKGVGLSGAEHASLIPCRAFRIEPHGKRSQIITLDGEVLPFGPFQCQVHPGIARIFGEETT